MTAADRVEATLAEVYAQGVGKRVAPGPAPARAAVPGARVPLAALAGSGPFGAAVADVLVDVLTPLRWEPLNPFNDHRGYPSPRATYLVDVHLVTDGGRWPVDPPRRALLGASAPALDDVVVLAVEGHPERLSVGYGDLAAALAELETGHLLAALAERADQYGLAVESHVDGLLVRWSGAPGHPGPVPRRSSGLGPRGLHADPRPLPAATARAVIAAAVSAVPGSPSAGAPLRVAVGIGNVTGIPDGWYRGGDSRLLRPAPAMAEAQAGFGYPRSTIDVAGMNLAVVITADVAGEVREHGAEAYPRLLRAAGAAVQHAATAAAERGMFCRPVRSVSEPALESACEAPPEHDLLYVALAGRTRVVGFDYDLRPLARSPQPGTTR
ncbi:hypothetical protein ACFPM7_16590 [Actinokineospora guangxiensis]|uniref:Uncharacterized protein n=1 Tax=Actinokineospora guangxiensis TaxID=1490288 RepID=A0ABW0ET45_9PSEU